MNCKCCDQEMKFTWWEPVSTYGVRFQTVNCTNVDCEARGITVKTERYATEDLSIWIEEREAYKERYRVGHVTPRLEAARAAVRAYVAMRNPKPVAVEAA